MSYEPWMLVAIDETGYNGIRYEHIEEVAKKLLETGKIEIDYTTFCEVCRECFIDPDNFRQDDLDKLQKRLNEQM